MLDALSAPCNLTCDAFYDTLDHNLYNLPYCFLICMPYNNMKTSVSRRKVLGTGAASLGAFLTSSDAVAGQKGQQKDKGKGKSRGRSPKKGDFETDFHDVVYFGDESSEKNKVQATASPVIEGGLGNHARSINAADGELSVTLSVEPNVHNMITLRMWGGDVKSVVESVDGQEFTMAARRLSFHIDGEELRTSDNFLDGKPINPGRFFYETIQIPQEYVEDKDKVTVVIGSTGTADGNYADVGGAPPEEIEGDPYSRGVYAAYTHTENFFAPPTDETQGSPMSTPEPSEPDFDEIEENIKSSLDDGVDELLTRQMYGPAFEDAVDSGDLPAKVHGLFHWQGIEPVLNNPDEWESRLTGSANARLHAQTPANFARAYKQEGSKHEGEEELIDRAVAALDGYCRYQGPRGHLEIGGGQRGWLGGPDRDSDPTGGGGLPGFFARGLANSFLELRPIMEEQGLLDDMIDNNGDGTESVTRRDAYTRLFRDYLWENALPRHSMRAGHANNQAIANAHSMLRANECLKYLSPDDTADEEILLKILRHKMGDLPIDQDIVDYVHNNTWNDDFDGFREHNRNKYGISPDGIPNENGYSPGYGFHPLEYFAEIGRQTNDAKIGELIRNYFDGIQHFVYPTLNQNGNRWSKISGVGGRGKSNAFSGANWYQALYAAKVLDHPAAQRILHEALRYGDDLASLNLGPGLQMHLSTGVQKWFRLHDRLSDFKAFYNARDSVDYQLPTERDGPYVWTDERMGPVMIKDDLGALYAQDIGDGDFPDYERVTDEYIVIGRVYSNQCPTSLVRTYEVGPYEIAMNRSDTVEYSEKGGPRVHVPRFDGRSALDLISGEGKSSKVDHLIDPADSLALDTSKQAPATQPRAEPSLDSTGINPTTRTKTWTWKVPQDGGGHDVVSLPVDDSSETDQVGMYYEAQGGSLNPVSAETIEDGQNRKLNVVNLDLCDHRMLISGTETGDNEIRARGLLPTFKDYNGWVIGYDGYPSSTATTDGSLEVTVDEERYWTFTRPTFFVLPVDETVERVMFLHESNGLPDRIGLTLENSDGETLWEGNDSDQVVSVDNVNEDTLLRFKVVNEASPTAIYPGWFQRISALRIEYKDGTAQFPNVDTTTTSTFDDWSVANPADGYETFPSTEFTTENALRAEVTDNRHFDRDSRARFSYQFDKTIETIRFNHEFEGDDENRMYLELTDESGEILWEMDDGSNQFVVLEDLDVTGEVRFEVYNRSSPTAIYPGWYHNIDNMMIEYDDGSVKYWQTE